MASPVISHIDIEEMQKKVHERSMLTGRSGRRSRASARQAAGQSVIASARYKPHMSGKQLSTARRTGQGARVPRQNMRGSTNRGRPKRNSLKLPRLDASGNAPPDAAPQQQSNGAPPSRGSDAVPMLRMPAREEHGQPQTDAGGDSLDDVAAKFEKEKWKHTSANAYGSFMPPEGLEILPQKPKRVGQEDRATVEWNLITEFELVRTGLPGGTPDYTWCNQTHPSVRCLRQEKAAAKDAEEHAREKKEKVETVAFLHKQAQEKALAKQREREASLAYDRQKMVRHACVTLACGDAGGGLCVTVRWRVGVRWCRRSCVVWSRRKLKGPPRSKKRNSPTGRSTKRRSQSRLRPNARPRS